MGLQIKKLKQGHYGYMNDVYGFWTGANSAGGFSVMLDFRYTGSKTIKYAYFKLYPVNSVHDIVADTISGATLANCKVNGFIYPNKWRHVYLENIWYNSSIRYVSLKEVVLQFTDGTEETIPRSSIEILNGGCYVATAVYGSYDCPQVWTLRRYRDYTLAKSWYGRAFIHTYYAISPTLVKWFGHTEWFKKMWKGKLDRMVADLNTKGVKDTPYEDRSW